MKTCTRTEIAPGTTGSWQDVDVTSYVGDDAGSVAGVMLEIVNSGVAERTWGVRCNGSSDTLTGIIEDNGHCWAAIGIDDDDIFEAYINHSDVEIYIVGYFLDSEATFLTDSSDKSLGTTDTWTDIDISGDTGDDTAIFAFFIVQNNAAGYEHFGFRENGCSDDIQCRLPGNEMHGTFAGLDSQVCEGYITDTGMDFFLVGWLTDNVTTLASAQDYSTGTTGSYVDADLSSDVPSGANGAFFLFYPPDGNEYSGGIRKNGESVDNYYDIARSAHGWVEVDSNRVIEQKIESASLDLYIIGYTEEPVTNQAPTAPTSLECEGQTNPTGVTDSTPEFSAIYNDPDTGDTATHFEVEVNTASDFSGTVMWDSGWIDISDITEGNRCSTVSYAGSTLGAGTTYYWRCRFKDDDAAEGSWSATANFTMESVPSAPTNCTAVNSGGTSSYCTWTDNSDNETQFRVEYRLDDGSWTLHQNASANATQCTTKSVGTDHKIEWRVRAENAMGQSSYSTSGVCYTTPDAPGYPSLSWISQDQTIRISWTDNSTYEDDFEIERSINDSAWTYVADPSSSPYNDTLPSGTDKKYEYRVRARTPAGEAGRQYSSWREGSVAIYSTPDAPSGVSASWLVQDETARVSWTDNSTYEDGFQIQCSIDAGGYGDNLGTPDASPFDDTNPTGCGHSYQYRVRAYTPSTGFGGSQYSSWVYSSVLNASPCNQAPSAPTSLECEGSTNPVNVTDATPEFTAIGNDPDSGDTLTHAEIEVGTSQNSSDMWDSGKIDISNFTEGNRCGAISYDGSSLSEGTKYYWRIRFWDDDDEAGAWSDGAAFFALSVDPITPTAVSVVCGKSDPAVVLGSVTVSPAAIAAITGKADPSVIQGSLTLTPTAIAAITGKADPSVIQGSLTLTPTAIAAVATRAPPAVVYGSVTVTPAAATAITAKNDPTIVADFVFIPAAATAVVSKVDPSVVLGSLSVTPSAISAVCDRAPPTVVQSSVTVTPDASIAVAAKSDPSVVQASVIVTPAAVSAITSSEIGAVLEGNVYVTPAAVSAVTSGADPTVVQTSITVAPAASTAVASKADPSVVYGSLTLTPEPASAVVSSIDPTIQADFTFTPTPASAIASKSDPTVVQGDLAITPTASTAITSSADPTIVADFVFTPGAVTAVASKTDPSVVQSSVTVTPTALSAVASKVDPSIIQGSVTVIPTALSAVVSKVDPSVVQGSVTITPTATSAVASRAGPTVVQSSVTVTPSAIGAVTVSIDPSVSIGTYVTPTPVSAIVSSTGPTLTVTGERLGYKVIIYDSSGTQIARIREWIGLSFTQVASGWGSVELVVPNDDKATHLANGNYIVIDRNGTDVFTGYFDWETWEWDEGGEGSEKLTIRGPSIDHLPPRQIERPDGEDEESHTDNVDDAIKAFVRNCYETGYADASRELSGFSVEADDAEYPTSKTLAGEYQDSILDKLEQWHEAYDIDWWVDADVEAQTFVFRTKYPRRGSDKSSSVYFTINRKNVRKLTYTKDAVDKANVVYVGGPGEGQSQTVSEIYSGDEPTGWDRREMYVGAPDAEYSDELDMVGNAALSVFGADIENVTFDYEETYGCQWVGDFEIGDKVTAYDPTFDVTVAAKIEEIQVEVLRVRDDIVENIQIRVGKDQADAWDRFKNKVGPFSKFDDDDPPAAPSNVGYNL